jgi:hypothetical protein
MEGEKTRGLEPEVAGRVRPRNPQDGGSRDLRYLPGYPQTLAQEKAGGRGPLAEVSLSPRFSTGRKRRILSNVEERRALWAQLEAKDEATLERHCELWEEEWGVKVSIATMSRAIRKRLGWTFKKRRWVPPSETKKREVLGGSV